MNLQFLTNKIIRQRWVQRYSSTTVVFSKINSPLGEGACADVIKINHQKPRLLSGKLNCFYHHRLLSKRKLPHIISYNLYIIWVICLNKVQEMWWLVQVTLLRIFEWNVFTITLVITSWFTQVRIVSRGKRDCLRQKTIIVQFQTTFYIFTYI